MLPLFDIQQLFTRLLSEPDPAALLSDLDPLTLEMIHRMANDHEGQLDYFHHLKFDKGGSQSGSLWHASTCVPCVSRLLDAIQTFKYDRPTIERHLNKLPLNDIALYYALMRNYQEYDFTKEAGSIMEGFEMLAERHPSWPSPLKASEADPDKNREDLYKSTARTLYNAYRTVSMRKEREGVADIKIRMERIRHYLPPTAMGKVSEEIARL